jgi:hypothetical protein
LPPSLALALVLALVLALALEREEALSLLKMGFLGRQKFQKNRNILLAHSKFCDSFAKSKSVSNVIADQTARRAYANLRFKRQHALLQKSLARPFVLQHRAVRCAACSLVSKLLLRFNMINATIESRQ